ncbi:GNAT family N-acetyltransferase [Desulfoluna butyratoxydans]|uniref:Acyl-coa n-acyltransferase n=1 Tax=Desulfoluna butyratoxydans TaxID=231438 RepID=A0A4U8YXC7_9BACT|nr:GNAT family N-acetyltransferase [Desulfoluna butyratoxydans]VFQ46103.1 acyl-coa n-acyltransferase [Desulfoluna butyratoxydans]
MMRTMPSQVLSFRPVDKKDTEFLFQVYASTRLEEMSSTGWGEPEIHAFLRDQFALQHAHYSRHHAEGDFSVILLDKAPVGRLYLDASRDGIRIMDIALLPRFRKQGIGTRIFQDLIARADGEALGLSLHVERHNPILAWYHRLGFETRKDLGVYLYLERVPKARAAR